MTNHKSDATKKSVDVAVLSNKPFLVRVIEDPFASALAATLATAGAVAVVLSSMWIISTAVY